MKHTYDAKQQFYQVPKLIMAGERYKKLSALDVMTYAVMLDRQQVSTKNQWQDEKGEIYFLYSNQQLADVLGVSVPTIITVKHTLMEVGLLRVVQTGRQSMLYLSAPIPGNSEEEKYILKDNSENKLSTQKMESKSKTTQNDTKTCAQKAAAMKNPVVIAPKKEVVSPQMSMKPKITTEDVMEKCFSVMEGSKQITSKEIKCQDERNNNPDIKKFNTSKTDINNPKLTILNNNNKSYDSSDEQMSVSRCSVKNIFPTSKNHGIEAGTFLEDITEVHDKKMQSVSEQTPKIIGQIEAVPEYSQNRMSDSEKHVHHFYDIQRLGLPDKIINLLETFCEGEDDLQGVLSLLFKAKSNVARRNSSMLCMEELTEYDFMKLYQVIYVALHKRKTDPQLRSFEAYLMRSFINFFEEHAVLEYEVNCYDAPIYSADTSEKTSNKQANEDLPNPIIKWG